MQTCSRCIAPVSGGRFVNPEAREHVWRSIWEEKINERQKKNPPKVTFEGKEAEQLAQIREKFWLVFKEIMSIREHFAIHFPDLSHLKKENPDYPFDFA